MGTRHRRHDRTARRAQTLVVTIAIALAFVAVAAAVAVNVVDSRPTASVERSAPPSPEQPISQQGRLVAVSPTSVTALGADGSARTFVVNSNTNAVTAAGSQVGGTASSFTVNDEVAIVGTVQNGTPVATVVADRGVSGLDGPPMDGVGGPTLDVIAP